MMCGRVLVSVLLLTTLILSIGAHPNCVQPVGGSYFPPKPDPPLRFCDEYAQDIDGACCTVETEMTFAGNVVPTVVDEGSACYPFVKQMFCTYCAPYAGHFYESEGNADSRQYSYMCTPYCERLWDACADVPLDADGPSKSGQTNRFPGLDAGMGVVTLSSMYESKEAFCTKYTTDNPVSCYSDDPKDKEVSFDGPGVPYKVYRAFPDLNLLTVPNAAGHPLHITHMIGFNDGVDKIAVAFQHGVVISFENTLSVTAYTVMLDIQSEVFYDGGGGSEYGCHGIAFHPKFDENGWMYVKYSHQEFQNQLDRYTISKGTGTADMSSKLIILSYETFGIMHHGGQPVFANDGTLFYPTGDGINYFSNFVEYNTAPDPQSLLGKVLRIDVDSATADEPYKIPADNPFVDNPNWLPEIYAYGFRNPWRFTYDPVKDRFWTGNVGQFSYEAVYVVEKGKFHGWHTREGNNCYYPISSAYGNGYADCATPGEVLPVIEFPHMLSPEFCEVTSDPPHCLWQIQGSAVIGGWVYRGSRNPSLLGTYIFTNFEPATAAKVYVAIHNENDPHQIRQLFRMELLNDAFAEFRIPTLGTDAAGEIYLINFDNPNEIWALEEEPKDAPVYVDTPEYKTPSQNSSSPKPPGESPDSKSHGTKAIVSVSLLALLSIMLSFC